MEQKEIIMEALRVMSKHDFDWETFAWDTPKIAGRIEATAKGEEERYNELATQAGEDAGNALKALWESYDLGMYPFYYARHRQCTPEEISATARAMRAQAFAKLNELVGADVEAVYLAMSN